MDVSEYIALMDELRAVDFDDASACRVALANAHALMQFKLADLAEKMGVSQQTIKHWMDGATTPAPAFMRSTFKHLMRVLEKEYGND